MNDYDKAGRYLIKRDPSRIIGWLLGRPTGVPFHVWLDTRRVVLPDQGDLTHDLVAACTVASELEGLCIELKARARADTLEQLVYGYMARLIRERGGPRLRAVGGLVVNFTGRRQADVIVQAPTLAPACQVRAQVAQCTLGDESAEATVTAVLAGEASVWLLGWLPLMQRGAEASIVALWRTAVMRLPGEQDQGILAGLTLTFATLARNRPVWERGLEGFNVSKSPYLEELREQVRHDARVEGRIEGRVEALRDVLLHLGQQHFRKAATRTQRAELEALTDLPRLERMRDRLLTVTTWRELLATP